MTSSSSPPTDDPSATFPESVTRERQSLESTVSGGLAAPRKLELELELELEPEPELEPELKLELKLKTVIAGARGFRKTIYENLDVPGSPRELVKISSAKREREAVDAENATNEIEPEKLMRSDLNMPRNLSATATHGRVEKPHQRKRSRTGSAFCFDGDDPIPNGSGTRVCPQTEIRGPSIPLSTTFRETPDHGFIFGRTSVFNQSADMAVDTQSKPFVAPHLSIDQEERVTGQLWGGNCG